MSEETEIRKLTYSDFENKKILGEGSFNQVYYADHPKLGPCVVKIVTRAFFAKQKQKKKLEEEAAHMFSIQHSNLIKGYGIVMEPTHLCLVYEYAKYGCLADLLRRIPQSFTWPLKIRTAFQTASAVNFLHNHTERLIHRNLKSTNILFDCDINVKVSDFITPKSTVWMSQATQQKEITERKKIAEGQPPVRKGRSLAHIPPEIVQNINTQAVESYDMYSYGVVLWELLTNKRPFDGATTEEVYRKMSEGFVHPFDAVFRDRPPCLFDIMKVALNIQVDQRPTFQKVCEKLKPFNDEKASDARKDAAKCSYNYDQYKESKRERQTSTSRQVSQEPSASIPTTPRTSKMESLPESSQTSQRAFTSTMAVSMKESPEDEGTGQIVRTTARVAEDVIPLEQPRKKPPVAAPTVKRTSQPTDTDEKMDVETFEEGTSSVSYTENSEHGSAPNKATPFVDAIPYMDENQQHIRSNQPPVRAVSASHAVYNIQAEHVNFHAGDNVVHGGGNGGAGDGSPPPVPDNSPIPATGSQRALTTKDKYVAVDHVGARRWRHMARHMGLSESQIDTIDYDFDRSGLKEKIYQAISKWELKFRGRATVGDLVDALKEANLHDVARKLVP